MSQSYRQTQSHSTSSKQMRAEESGGGLNMQHPNKTYPIPSVSSEIWQEHYHIIHIRFTRPPRQSLGAIERVVISFQSNSPIKLIKREFCVCE